MSKAEDPRDGQATKRDESLPAIEYRPPSIEVGSETMLEASKWIESPQHYSVFFLATQGLNYGLVNASAEFADAVSALPFAYCVTWGSDEKLRDSYAMDISHENHMVHIKVSRETAVWNFSAVFKEIALELLRELDASNEYDADLDGLPTDAVAEYTGSYAAYWDPDSRYEYEHEGGADA